MNFYEHQAQARKRTTLLVVFFALAVLMIVLALNAVAYAAMVGASGSTGNEPLSPMAWLEQPYWLWISGAVVALIAGSSLFTLLRLRGGGQALAAMVGAREIDLSSKDAQERQLINIVEEMSIASGTPMPVLYVLDDEPGINAFVAGTRPSETVMVVTRGALDSFTRDEMQGVVAHEYSHIFNNDMRINIRLMGVLAGILVIGQIGRVMLRSGAHSRSKNSGQAMAVGLAVLAIGYIGLFFGALIKAAISRQREFLADASAVQFTRNPDGISGALRRIQQHVEGTQLRNSHSEDLSHFCFGESVSYFFGGLMSTHPPLEKRIRAIDPRAGHEAGMRPGSGNLASQGEADGLRNATPGITPAVAAGFASENVRGAPVTPAHVAASVGTVSAAQLAFARELESGIEQNFPQIHTPAGAQQILCAMLLEASAEKADADIRRMIDAYDAEITSGLDATCEALRTLPPDGRFGLLNIVMSVLKRLARERKPELLMLVKQIVHADGEYSLYEFCVLTILLDHLRIEAATPPPVTITLFASAHKSLGLVLSILADSGTPDAVAADAAFAAARDILAEPTLQKLVPQDQMHSDLVNALDELAGLSPILKQDFIRACAACVIHDGVIAPGEGEVLQVIALKLDCPMPPLLSSAHN